MPARTRTIGPFPLQEVTYWIESGSSQTNKLITTKYSFGKYCEDVTGSRFTTGGVPVVHPFHMRSWKHEGHIANGRYKPSSIMGARVYKDHPGAYHGDIPYIPTSDVNNPSHVNTTLARTGLNSTKVSLPLVMAEALDVPKMLKQAGDLMYDTFSRKGFNKLLNSDSGLVKLASTNLAWKFGWAPIIEDLDKILNLAEHTRKRRQEIVKSRTRAGLKRRISLGNRSGSQQGYTSTIGPVTIPAPMLTWKSNTWAVTRWHCRDDKQIGKPVPDLTAFKAITGLKYGHIPQNVWNYLPWTWLSDWFIDISSVIRARHNLVEYKASNLCVMEHTVASYIGPGASKSGVSVSALNNTHERKMRSVYPTVGVHSPLKLPYLDSFKLSVLGSLTVLKGRKFTR